MKNFKKVLCFAAFVFIFSGCQTTEKPSESNEELTIIPKPAKAVLNTGNFVITKNTVIFCNNKELLPVAKYMVTKISGATGFSLQIKEGSGKGINFEISGTADSTHGNEGYKLQVTQKNVVLTANKANGVFYGIQSLLQLLPPQIKSNTLQKDVEWKIPC
ncbi:MAG TPA: glycoside hydrolase family 20 zincin-like fold domain-containing protein, partial [Draconibacterium sp.]|nr:glycoside hydrolase family 20 zincin-like fold domain-containing protein [Draconibacterium sp.]